MVFYQTSFGHLPFGMVFFQEKVTPIFLSEIRPLMGEPIFKLGSNPKLNFLFFPFPYQNYTLNKYTWENISGENLKKINC